MKLTMVAVWDYSEPTRTVCHIAYISATRYDMAIITEPPTADKVKAAIWKTKSERETRVEEITAEMLNAETKLNHDDY